MKDYNFVKKPYVEYADLINKSNENLQTIYSSIHGGSVSIQLVNMAPKKYISECAKMMGVSEKELRESREDENLNKYRANKNITFPIGYIDYILKKQDGLHRAIVAEENKQNEIPICVIRRSKNMKVKDSNITQEIAKKLKQINPQYDYGFTGDEVRIYNVPRGTKLQSVKSAVQSIIGDRDVGVQNINQQGHIITIKIRDCDIMKKFKVKIGDKVFKVKAKDETEAKLKAKDMDQKLSGQTYYDVRLHSVLAKDDGSGKIYAVSWSRQPWDKTKATRFQERVWTGLEENEFDKNSNKILKAPSYTYTTTDTTSGRDFVRTSFKAHKVFRDSEIKAKDDTGYEWMRRLSSNDYSFINGGYGMKFKNAEKYNNAKRIAKELGYTKGHWYDDKLEYFDYGSTVIRNEDSVEDAAFF